MLSFYRGYRHAISTYNKAVAAAEDVPEALAPVLLNRAMAEFKLGNFGRALGDLEKSLSLMPGNAKAHYRYAWPIQFRELCMKTTQLSLKTLAS